MTEWPLERQKRFQLTGHKGQLRSSSLASGSAFLPGPSRGPIIPTPLTPWCFLHSGDKLSPGAKSSSELC